MSSHVSLASYVQHVADCPSGWPSTETLVFATLQAEHRALAGIVQVLRQKAGRLAWAALADLLPWLEQYVAQYAGRGSHTDALGGGKYRRDSVHDMDQDHVGFSL